jgi:hypothetical protein
MAPKMRDADAPPAPMQSEKGLSRRGLSSPAYDHIIRNHQASATARRCASRPARPSWRSAPSSPAPRRRTRRRRFRFPPCTGPARFRNLSPALSEAVKQWSLTSLQEKATIPRDTAADRGTTAIASGSGCMRHLMVIGSGATDGRIAAKCPRKPARSALRSGFRAPEGRPRTVSLCSSCDSGLRRIHAPSKGGQIVENRRFRRRDFIARLVRSENNGELRLPIWRSYGLRQKPKGRYLVLRVILRKILIANVDI